MGPRVNENEMFILKAEKITIVNKIAITSRASGICVIAYYNLVSEPLQ